MSQFWDLRRDSLAPVADNLRSLSGGLKWCECRVAGLVGGSGVRGDQFHGVGLLRGGRSGVRRHCECAVEGLFDLHGGRLLHLEGFRVGQGCFEVLW